VVPGGEASQDLAAVRVLDSGDATLDRAFQAQQSLVACGQNASVDQDRTEVRHRGGRSQFVELCVRHGAGSSGQGGKHPLRADSGYPVESGRRVGGGQGSHDGLDLGADGAVGAGEELVDRFGPSAGSTDSDAVLRSDGTAPVTGEMGRGVVLVAGLTQTAGFGADAQWQDA
jgi:hypothetical protein